VIEENEANAQLETGVQEKEKKRDELFILFSTVLTRHWLRSQVSHIKLRSIKRVLEECRSLIGRETWSQASHRLWVGCGSASAATMYVWNDEWIHASIHHIRCVKGQKALLDDLSSQGDQRNAPRITMSTHLGGVFVNHIRLGSLCLHDRTTSWCFHLLRQLFMETSTWWNPRHDRTWDSRWL
jgi:hypothetical protein